MTDWVPMTVDDVCTRVTSGGTPSRRVPAYFHGNVPWLKTQELVDGIVVGTEEHITEDAISNSSAKLLPVNTVMMAMYGATVGKLAILGVPMTCNQAACAMLVDPDKVDYRFLYYQLLNARPRIVKLATGAAQQNLSGAVIKALSFEFPSLEEQHAISATLGALDDKVDSNRHAIALMEDLGANILEDTLGSDPALDGGTLGECLSVLETGSRPLGGATAEGVVSLGAEHVKSAGVGELADFKRVPEEFAASLRRGHLEDGDVLVYKDGAGLTSGASIVSAFGYGFPVDHAVINEHVYRVRAEAGISQALLYWLLRSDSVNAEIRKRVTGAAQPGLNSTNFKAVPLPDLSKSRDQLNDQLTLLFERMLALGAENRKLVALRDALLPELLSGRIHVSEVAEVAEATE